MALKLGDKMLDAGLGYVSSNADRIYICSAQPTTYTEATSTFALGYKAFGVGAVAGAPQAGTSGRKVVTNAVSGGIVTAVGMPAYWAIVDTVNSLLLATGDLSGGVTTDITKAWTLGAISINETNALVSRTFDTATTAWVTAVTTAGGSVSYNRKSLIDDLISGLKADGIWSKLDRLWVYAAENPTSALIDLTSHPTATLAGSPPFIVDQGYQTFGRGGYAIAANYDASTSDAVNLVQNSAHISNWNLTNYGATNDLNFGIWGSALEIFARSSDVAFGAALMGNIIQVPNTNARGFFLANCSSAGANQLYKDGVNVASDTIASHAAPTGTVNLDYGSHIASSLGGSLTATQVLAFYNRLLTYAQAVFKVTNTETMSWMRVVNQYYTGAGIVSPARATLVDTLISGLKSDGVWAKLDRLYIFAAENINQALIDLRTADYFATAVNSPTFTANLGYTFNGTSSYFNTGFGASANSVHQQDSAHFSAWATTTPTNSLGGEHDGTQGLQLAYVSSSWNIIGPNDSTQTSTGVAAPSTGLIALTRTASNSRALYVNGASAYSDAVVSTFMPTQAYFVGATLTFGGGPGNFTASQIACATIGAGLTATDNTNLYNRLRTFMTAVGVP